MFSAALLVAVLALPSPTPAFPDTVAPGHAPPPDSVASAPDSAVGTSLRRTPLVWIAADTVRPRARAVEVSDDYALRLRIHRYASYTTVPLFLLQTVAGNQLYQADRSGSSAPTWAKTTHSVGAAGLGALFTVNTVTGVWNLWDSRHQEEGRAKRLLHGALLLAADAGMAYTGLVLAGEAEDSESGRRDHRNGAYISMGTALVGYGVMLLGDH